MDIILNAKIVYYFFLCMCICGCGDESSTLSVIPQEVYSGSLIGLELTNCARLAGQWAPEVCLSTPSQSLHYKDAPYPALPGFWELN